MTSSVELGNTYTIYQGDSTTPVRFRVNGIDVSTCTCKQVVRTDLNATADIDATVTDTVTIDSVEWFRVSLSPTQTTGLAADREYFWIHEIDCPSASPVQRYEVHHKLIVKPQGAT